MHISPRNAPKPSLHKVNNSFLLKIINFYHEIIEIGFICSNLIEKSHQHSWAFWPEPTTFKTKLWGTVDDLWRTESFVYHHGLRI
jgi:hypothetical protein